MENLTTRYRNVTILVAVLFAQVLGLAVQVRRSSQNESSRLIRVWALNSIAPLEKAIVWSQNGVSGIWHNYLYLRGVRQENRDLKEEIERLRLEQVRLSQDAEQAQRLQALLGFREQFISQTLPAQAIGTAGSAQSRLIEIDKGSRDGIKKDMAVLTANGVAGKVLLVDRTVSQVLLINDPTSGMGVILEKSRLQGVLTATASGELVLEKIMNDEEVESGEKVLTSGGDQIFPKGLLVGTVSKVSHGRETFLDIRVKPAADLARLEEVLVITKKEEREPSVADSGPVRAVDILAQRLPSVPDKPADPKQGTAGGTPANSAAPTLIPTPTVKPEASVTHDGSLSPKPAGNPAIVSTGKTIKPATPAVKPVNSTAKPPASQAKAPVKTPAPENNSQ